MPNCTFLFYRHSHVDMVREKPTGFAAKRLKPLIERSVNGSPLHVVHDRVPSIPLFDGVAESFENLLKIRKFVRDMKGFERDWRNRTKGELSAADRGEETPFLDHRMFPEFLAILEANRKRPGSVVNHLGFYPFEAAVEKTRSKIHISRAMEMMRFGDLNGGVRQIMESQWAMASCSLLRDAELMKQIPRLGENAVVMRGLSHTYLLELDRYSIPIVDGLGKVVEFRDIVERKGIAIDGEVEGLKTSFREEAVRKLCSADIEMDEHQRLALLEILYVRHLNPETAWDSQESRDSAFSLALRDVDCVNEKPYG
ncbi:hypothetical protein GF318_05190 [Candidatus Micrarchaeota archaeon]|nr:hypothetical protein [Candidatus Micrarchaeota archaeon]